MGVTLADTYYLKAKAASDDYCNDWDTVCESLNYALSYDENHCASLCLLGEIYARNLGLYEEAFSYFDKALAVDYTYTATYSKYIKYLLWAGKIESAEKLLEYALSVKGISKATLFWLSSYTEEIKENYTVCLEFLKKAKLHAYNEDYYHSMEEEEKRIKKKIKLLRPKKKNSKASKSSSKKK